MKPRPYRNVSPSAVLLMRQIIVGTMIAAFFGMLIITVWYTTRADAFTITTVTVRGGETIAHSDVEAVVKAKIDGAYLKLIPRAFAYTYPLEEIKEAVHGVGRIKEVRVMRTSGNELVIEFTEYAPQALWCQSVDSTQCFFLDEGGYSFSKAPDLEGGSFTRFVSIGREPGEHVQAFPAEDYARALELVKKFADAKWFVSKVEIDGAGDGFLTIVDGGEFKVSLKLPADETVSNLLTVLGSENFAHIKPGNFEYVDLRFGSKVFVNEVTLETSASSTATSSAPASGGEVAAAQPEAAPQTPAPAADDSVEIPLEIPIEE